MLVFILESKVLKVLIMRPQDAGTRLPSCMVTNTCRFLSHLCFMTQQLNSLTASRVEHFPQRKEKVRAASTNTHTPSCPCLSGELTVLLFIVAPCPSLDLPLQESRTLRRDSPNRLRRLKDLVHPLWTSVPSPSADDQSGL